MTTEHTDRWDDRDTDAAEPDECWFCGQPACDGDCEAYVLSVRQDAADNASEQEVQE